MHILLLGKNGQLGWELRRTLAPLGEVIALDYPEIDLARTGPDRDRAIQVLRDSHPQIILNATAYTAVDQAEKEPNTAMAVNAQAPGLLAEISAESHAALIHYSTDYVFDGRKGSAYIESDVPKPLNVYGKSKLVGERAIEASSGAYLILRTSWVYSLRGDSFVNKVLRWGREQKTLRVVEDQISGPTWARMLAEATAQLLARAGKDAVSWLNERRGTYHLAGSGHASRLEWAKAVLRLDPRQNEQIVEQILAAATTDFPTPAQRPLFSALNCDRFIDTFGLSLPDWETALQLALQDE